MRGGKKCASIIIYQSCKKTNGYAMMYFGVVIMANKGFEGKVKEEVEAVEALHLGDPASFRGQASGTYSVRGRGWEYSECIGVGGI